MNFAQSLATGLMSTGPGIPLASYNWTFVRRRFDEFLSVIEPTDQQRETAEQSAASVSDALHRQYWPGANAHSAAAIIGSWSKGLEVRPLRDIDLFFELPADLVLRYEQRQGNRQSQLLQELRAVLSERFPRTILRGDRQALVVEFDRITVEVVPGFCSGGHRYIADASAGGIWKPTGVDAELQTLNNVDLQEGGAVRALVRMMKVWQRYQEVPIPSYLIERLAVQFVPNWYFTGRDSFWFDWLVRDFLAYLVSMVDGTVVMPGTGEVVPLGRNWLRLAQQSYEWAREACVREYNNDPSAGVFWQAIFGADIPREIA